MAISSVTYASRWRRNSCLCHAFSLIRAVHATMARIYEMIIVIYSSIKRLVLGVKTTLCEVKA
jgi:hypothetical protein